MQYKSIIEKIVNESPILSMFENGSHFSKCIERMMNDECIEPDEEEKVRRFMSYMPFINWIVYASIFCVSAVAYVRIEEVMPKISDAGARNFIGYIQYSIPVLAGIGGASWRNHYKNKKIRFKLAIDRYYRSHIFDSK